MQLPPCRPRLAAGFVLLALLGGCSDAPVADERPPHVVLVVIDTLRADAVGCYGGRVALADGSGEVSPTPVFDALAERGVLFEDVEASSSWTATSTVSFLSGLDPAEHGVRSKKLDRIPDDVTMLMDALGDVRYRTCCVMCNPILGPELRFVERFDDFRRMQGSPAAPAIDEALALVDERLAASPDQPLFLYVHLFDPHWPYDAAAPELERFAPGPSPMSAEELLPLARRMMAGDPEAAAELVTWAKGWASHAYMACVASADREMGRLFDGLDTRGVLGDSLVVVTSDHGEEFGEHGVIGHGRQLFAESVRVPLVIAGPGVPAGERVAEQVELRSIAPTVLQRLGILGLSPIRGRDLLDAASRAEGEDDAHYAMISFCLAPDLGDGLSPTPSLHSLRKGSRRIVCTASDEGIVARERGALVSLDANGWPERITPLDAVDEATWSPLFDELSDLVRTSRTPDTETSAAAHASRQESLRQLGYVGATGEDGDAPR